MKFCIVFLVLISACSKKEEQAIEINPLYKKQTKETPIQKDGVQRINPAVTPAKIEGAKVEERKKVDLPQMEGFQASSREEILVPIDTKPGDPPNLPQMGSEKKVIGDPEILPPSGPGESPSLPRSGR